MSVGIKLSHAMLMQTFHPCTPDFIANVCQGACCRSTKSPSGILVAVAPSEAQLLERYYQVTVNDGELQPRPGTRVCPFQQTAGTCQLHGTLHKPWGCIASPFTLSKRGTLVIRNRYRLLRCYRATSGKVPAYVAHRASLDQILGNAQAEWVCGQLARGLDSDLLCAITDGAYARLIGTDATRQRAAANWHQGGHQ